MRESANTRYWHELFVSTQGAGDSKDVCTSVVDGHSILVFDALIDQDECEQLTARSRCSSKEAFSDPNSSSRVRLPVTQIEQEALCENILLRVLVLLRQQLPLLCQQLFGDLISSACCIRNPAIKFSPGEPAINVYRTGGRFKPHEDKQSLTVLVSLSCPSAFTGGGTGFWSIEDRGPRSHGSVATSEPTVVVRANAGTALVFTGAVTHAGLPVTSGERMVFVSSFSPMEKSGSTHHDSVFRAARRRTVLNVEQNAMIQRALALRKADQRPRRERIADRKAADRT